MSGHALDYPPVSNTEDEYEMSRPESGRTVVLGYDGSKTSREAAHLAGELAGPHGRVVAVRSRPPAGEDEFAGLDQRLVAPAKLETRASIGAPPEAIAGIVRQISAAYIVLGWDANQPGRVFRRLIETGVCPVVVVPPCSTGRRST